MIKQIILSGNCGPDPELDEEAAERWLEENKDTNGFILENIKLFLLEHYKIENKCIIEEICIYNNCKFGEYYKEIKIINDIIDYKCFNNCYVLITKDNMLQYWDGEYNVYLIENIYDNIYCSLPIFGYAMFVEQNVLYDGIINSMSRRFLAKKIILDLVKNNVDKYIAFGGSYEYVCIVDKNGNIFLQKHHNKFVRIGRLYGKYLMFVKDHNLIIVQK